MSAGDWKDMIYAIQDGDIDLVRYHMQRGVNPNYQHPEFMTTPLIECIYHDRLEIAQFLLKSGADPSLCIGFSSDSPLSLARQSKNAAMVTLLKTRLPKKNNILRRFVNKILRIDRFGGIAGALIYLESVIN